MLPKKLTKELVLKIFTSTVAELEAKQEELNRLDAAIGDGDHGTSIVKAMRAAAVAMEGPENLKDALYNAGFAAESQDCGSTSSLIGSFWQGMSEKIESEELLSDDAIQMFSAGLDAVKKMTKAQVGDKTLMDALIPAVDYMKSQFECNASLQELFESAAESAQFGTDATVDYIAKFGRAKNLGERSKGHLDAGAVSMAIIFKAFANGVNGIF